MVAKTVVSQTVSWQVNENDWRSAFAAWDEYRGKSANTVAAHQQDMRVFCDWFALAAGSEFTPEQLNSFDLRRFRAWQLDVARVKPATWNRRLASLRALATWSRRAGLDQPDDLFEGVMDAKEVTPPPDWLTNGDFDRLARYIESSAFDPYDDRTPARRARAVRNRALAAVMLYAGLREAEAADLEMADLDLSERKGKIVVRKGKGAKRREVPVADAGLRRVLRRWLDLRGEDSGCVFTNDVGARLSERAIQEAMGEIGLRCRVADMRAHRLRHTFCKRLADAGKPIQVIARLAGHADLNVTRRYLEPGEEDLREAVAQVSQGKMAIIDERSSYGKRRRTTGE